MLKILTTWCCLIITKLDGQYWPYYNPKWQWSMVPWFGTYEPISVIPLYDEKYSRQIEAQHLLNMSMELLKDVNIKNRHSMHVQKTYQQDGRYKLGLITAGSIDKFAHMVKIFKYYCRPEIYDVPSNDKWKHRHATISMHQAYQIMQGDYNEMRVENELFFDNIAHSGKGYKGEGSKNVEDFKDTMSLDEWNKLNEDEQNKKIEEFKSIYGSRRSMTQRPRRTKLNFTADAAQEEYKRSLRYFARRCLIIISGIGYPLLVMDVPQGVSERTTGSDGIHQIYKKWSEKWKGFDPKIEGVEISRPLARMGKNMSKFLGVNPF